MFSENTITLDTERILQSQEMLTAEVIIRSQEILKYQFPAVQGLYPPIPREEDLTLWSDCEQHNSYPPCQKKAAYIQILNTGSAHWIVCFKPKGIPFVTNEQLSLLY